MYFIHQPHSLSTYYRNGGAVELVNSLTKYQNNFSQITITNSPDNIYPWYAFFNQLNPHQFNQKIIKNQSFSWNNIIFSAYKCPSEKILKADIVLPNQLIIDAEG